MLAPFPASHFNARFVLKTRQPIIYSAFNDVADVLPRSSVSFIADLLAIIEAAKACGLQCGCMNEKRPCRRR